MPFRSVSALARGKKLHARPFRKNRLAADRTSCHQAEANQFRLFLHHRSQ
jgi:hypothetical protein